ncbi:unnamed protein product, partial [Heterosigma akashiwo]
ARLHPGEAGGERGRRRPRPVQGGAGRGATYDGKRYVTKVPTKQA